MGIKKIILANGAIKFAADARVRGTPRRTATFDTKEDAEKFISEIRVAARKALNSEAKYKLAQAAKIGGQRTYERAKLSDVIAAFRESPKCSPRGKDALVRAAELVGDVDIASANEDWVERYVSQMRHHGRNGKPYAYSTIKAHLIYFELACNWWAKQNRVNPAQNEFSTECFPEQWEVKRTRRIETGEYDKIVNRIAQKEHSEHWKCLIDLCLETGARLQELILAEWGEIGRGDQIWTIPLGHTKKRTERKVPLSSKARSIVTKLRLLSRDDETRIFWVFPTPRSVSVIFRRMARQAGVQNFRFHDLRHESISKMIINYPDVPVRAVMEIVGHKSYDAFVRYSHLREDELIGLFD